MKTKLTLTIDPKVSHKAKQVARQRGMSLSAMVEEALSVATGDSTSSPQGSTFSNRWRGRMELKEDDSPRSMKLREKYGLSDAI